MTYCADFIIRRLHSAFFIVCKINQYDYTYIINKGHNVDNIGIRNRNSTDYQRYNEINNIDFLMVFIDIKSHFNKI